MVIFAHFWGLIKKLIFSCKIEALLKSNFDWSKLLSLSVKSLNLLFFAVGLIVIGLVLHRVELDYFLKVIYSLPVNLLLLQFRIPPYSNGKCPCWTRRANYSGPGSEFAGSPWSPRCISAIFRSKTRGSKARTRIWEFFRLSKLSRFGSIPARCRIFRGFCTPGWFLKIISLP